MSLPPRPKFEPPAPDELPRKRTGPLLAWLRLMRLPNVFTALADAAMGYLFVHGAVASAAQLGCLAAASGLLYTAGMVLNDVFDCEVDAKERPFRPLPSGQISRGTARAFGLLLLAFGVIAGWLAGYLPAPAAASLPWRSGLVASLLAAAILLYDGWLKFTPFGPLSMGLCRFLNVLLGMSTAAYVPSTAVVGYGPAELLAATGIAVYIVGVTWLARSEAGQSQSGLLIAAMIVMSAGVAILGSSAGHLLLVAVKPTYYWVLLGLLMVTVLRRCGVAAADPTTGNVQAAVKHSILSLIWLDAATAAAAAGPGHGLAIALLLIPALVLGRWVYST